MTVKEVVPINSRKFKVIFEENYSIPLYKTEIRRYNIEAGRELEDSDMNEIHKTLISRIKNRILYLLEDSDKSNYLRISILPVWLYRYCLYYNKNVAIFIISFFVWNIYIQTFLYGRSICVFKM